MVSSHTLHSLPRSPVQLAVKACAKQTLALFACILHCVNTRIYRAAFKTTRATSAGSVHV